MSRFRWTTVVPVLAAALTAATWGSRPGTVVLALAGVFLAAGVLAAVHHAVLFAAFVFLAISP